jgi:hypothetical protein
MRWFSRSSAAKSRPEQQHDQGDGEDHLPDSEGHAEVGRAGQLGDPDGHGEDGGEDAEVEREAAGGARL